MRVSLVVGMVAGSVLGATAAIIAMPYFQPQLKRAVTRSRQAIDAHMDKMESGS